MHGRSVSSPNLLRPPAPAPGASKPQPLGVTGRLSGGHSIQRIAKPPATGHHAPVSEIVQPPLDAARALDVRQGRPEQPLGSAGLQDISRRAHAMGVLPHHLAAQARSLLRNPRTGKVGVASSRALLAGLDEEDQDDLIAFLTPVQGVHHDADGLARRFQEAYDDEELTELLKSVLADADVSSSDHGKLVEELRRARLDKGALMTFLARVHGIPRPIQEREALKQLLEDRLREHELAEGRADASTFRALGAAKGLDDPGLFLQTFEEVKTREKGGWLPQMQALAKSYSPQALPGALLALIHAVGAEMQVVNADRGDVQHAHLGAITSELQQAYKCQSLVYSDIRLVNWIKRLMGPPERMREPLPGLLNILAKSPPMPHHFDGLAAECAVPNGEPKIAFFTGLYQMLAFDLPPEAFADRRVREATLEAVQSALDAAIEEDEAGLEQSVATQDTPSTGAGA